MNLIERNNSVITRKNNLEKLITLKNFPVFFGCTNEDISKDLFADMEWSIDPDTGVIQLSKLIPLEILYQAQHVDGIGGIWEDYYDYFASYIQERKPSTVLEIGGGSGRLAEKVISKNINLNWTIVEPNPTYDGKYNIKLISTFFDENFKADKKYDTVVFSQVLEHAYDPMSFIKNISSFLDVGGKLIFAFPNLEHWVRMKYANSLNFEHTMLLSEKHVEYMLSKFGMRITNKTIYKEHSILYTTIKSENVIEDEIENKYVEYKKLFTEFIGNYYKEINIINKKIENNDSNIYLFGAHIFSQYLLCLGLNRNRIKCILDNSKLKQGKRLYGTDIKVDSPLVLRYQKTPVVILKAGIYNEEIKKDIIENINPTVIFWE